MSERTAAPPDIRLVKAPSDRLDDVKPLWFMLHRQHVAVADDRRGPVRSDEESWRIKRRWYEDWLADEDSFLLLAEMDGRAVGYAVVRMVRPDPTPTWHQPPRKAEIEALAIAPEAQREGVGQLMIDGIKHEVQEMGVEVLGGAVIGGNDDAVRFYEREGGYVTYVKIDFRFEDGITIRDPGVVDETDD
jgi:ribosomal protein S18 acetylase RimI-like enzyme